VKEKKKELALFAWAWGGALKSPDRPGREEIRGVRCINFAGGDFGVSEIIEDKSVGRRWGGKRKKKRWWPGAGGKAFGGKGTKVVLRRGKRQDGNGKRRTRNKEKNFLKS